MFSFYLLNLIFLQEILISFSFYLTLFFFLSIGYARSLARRHGGVGERETPRREARGRGRQLVI
jgi:hypothetical protein